MRGTSCLMVFFLVFLVGDFVKTSVGVNVTYDNRAIIIDGKRRVLVSGSIHFPRSTPEMWPDLIQKSKEGGLDIIETYVFWNLHEPVRNQYNFEGRNDLVRFMKAIAAAGMYAHLRIGPYVCAEWNYGAFPLWLHFIPGIKFRTDNEPYKAEMQRFTTKIVQMMKDNNLYASQGGPIILSQIENEYGNVMSNYGSAAQTYVKWAAGMAMSLNTGVPWVMCQQSDTPDPLINACNGFYCDNFTPNSPKKPKMWTENWTGWFLDFGGAVPYRPSEDVAFAVARFYQRNGTFQNYYMYHGGTNFGHTSGGPFITTSYDYDAPLDEYGLIRQPKYGHLKDLHNAIKQSEGAMVAAEATNSSLGSNLEASVYNSSSGCAAFLANIGTGADATVNFNGNSYNLPAWSVSILPDCKNAVYNTAKINSSYVRKSPDAQITPSKPLATGWSSFNEPVGISIKNTFTKPGLLEQINTTSDKSDYLWYSISTDIKGNEGFLKNGTQTVLHVESLGHVLHAYVNGKLAGSGFGNGGNPKVTADISVSLNKGTNKFDLLSATVGLQNYGAFFDLTGAGITGPVKLKGSSDTSDLDLSPQQWTYQVGLKGEDVGLPGGTSNLWASQSPLPTKQPLTWYKTTFDAPPGNNPAVLNMTGMGKGEAWVNGQSIGRYWPTNIAKSTKCTALCDYRGKYDGTSKCVRNCGKPSQELYHVPRSWIKPNGNTLVLFEEMGGDPTQISFATLQRP